jgi:hypothetical protein
VSCLLVLVEDLQGNGFFLGLEAVDADGLCLRPQRLVGHCDVSLRGQNADVFDVLCAF